MATKNEEKLHVLMYTLLYPAVLGTMIVGLVFAFTESLIGFEYRSYVAIFLIIYFSSQHVENAEDKASYSWPKFGMDVLEIIFIFGLFLLLGVYKFTYAISTCTESYSEWCVFYACLAFTFLIPVVTRWIEKKAICGPRGIFEKNNGMGQSILSIIAVGFSTLSLIVYIVASFEINNDFVSTLVLLIYDKCIIISVLAIVLAVYLIFFVFETKTPRCIEKIVTNFRAKHNRDRKPL